jgi:Tetratricopeptide repeat
VMAKRKLVLGDRHPDTLMAMANLARTWKSQGRNQEAIALMRQVERLQREVLGIDHRQTMNSSEAMQSWLTTDVDDSATH